MDSLTYFQTLSLYLVSAVGVILAANLGVVGRWIWKQRLIHREISTAASKATDAAESSLQASNNSSNTDAEVAALRSEMIRRFDAVNGAFDLTWNRLGVTHEMAKETAREVSEDTVTRRELQQILADAQMIGDTSAIVLPPDLGSEGPRQA
jgi:cytoskeletal protein RodZ